MHPIHGPLKYSRKNQSHTGLWLGSRGVPHEWVSIMKRKHQELRVPVSTRRMINDYIDRRCARAVKEFWKHYAAFERYLAEHNTAQ